MTTTLLKNKKFQIIIVLTVAAAVILFALLTDFPEGSGQGSIRNKRLTPTMQPPTQNQSMPQNFNVNGPSQPNPSMNNPVGNSINPVINGFTTQDNGY